ncbi:TonB-dependent receptor domain-containing protein [Robertkochia solimangrovi]|uniref:TonB-dependent receptor domain-containing protein n=1 Tax=Robertkochia solimangrovi TaxID=2213046 RepID=UPI00117D658C|nr:TonB-dependent receptor [Robertkochia solimangrovi]TRZ42956.1 TonB-dependent receptor [Robertkochia solimangrovi]
MKLFLFNLFLLLLQVVYSQETIAITGQILDQETQHVLPYVTIVVNDATSKIMVSGTISDENGRFEIKSLSTGNYIVNISFLGYETVEYKITSGGLNPIFDLGKITLKPLAENLDEVTVTAKRSMVNAALDSKSFNIKDNIAQSGGSVADAMKTMPGVAFDQDGKVILRGSDKVMVLIDGKQSSLTGFGNQKGLNNIPASNIERIEIINNPSAKYDATGNAGIINIIYKKEQQTGLNGDVGLSFGLGVLSKRKADTPTDYGSYSMNPKLIPSLNLNYRTTKMNYFLQSEFIAQEALPNNEFTTRHYKDGRNIISQVPENRKQFRTIISGGIDWDLSTNDALTISGMYDREKHVDTSQVAFINLDNNMRNRLYSWREVEITSFINIAANYKHSFEQPGHSFSANLQYTRGLEDETYSLNDSSAIRVGKDKTNIRAIEHTTTMSTDYTRALSSGKIEAGIKLRFRYLPVNYTIYPGNQSIIYPNLGDYSNWKENLYAVYGNYILEKEHYDIEAGLRAEQTAVSYNLDPQNTYYPNNDKYEYFELFPNIRFTWKINDKNKLSIFYNRRIDRPGEPELRIFPKYDDPELLKVGNPYLRPQTTNSYEAAHRFRWGSGSLYSAAYFREINHTFLRIYSIDNSNYQYDIVNKIYSNVDKSTNSGIELLFSQDISDNWKITASGNFYINRIEAFQGTLLFPTQRSFTIDNSKDKAGDIKISNSFNLPWDSELQLTGLWYSSRNIPQGTQLARSSIDLGYKKNLWNKTGEITLSASDLFNNFGLRQKINGDGFSTLYENYYETQIVRLGMKYKF